MSSHLENTGSVPGPSPMTGGRLAVFGILMTLSFLVVAARLVQLQVMDHDKLVVEAADQVYGTVRERDKRGVILDARGRTLAVSVEAKACALDPKALFDAAAVFEPEETRNTPEAKQRIKARVEAMVERFAGLVELTPADRQRIANGLEKTRSVNGKEEHVRFVWVKRRLTGAEWERLEDGMRTADKEASDAWRYFRRWRKRAGDLKIARDEAGRLKAVEAMEGWRRTARERQLLFAGVMFPPEFERVFPQGSLASHVLGFGDVDGRGLEGMEKTCEAFLKGTTIEKMVARDARSRALSSLVSDERSPEGMTVVLTIDSVVQAIVEDELTQVAEDLKRQFPAVTANAVVMDPSDGSIIAIANYPSFDPNAPADSPARNRRNDVVAAVQEPGSTFKPLLIAAGLEEKTVSLDEEFNCATFTMSNGRVIKDIHPYGRMTLQMAVVKSSNPGMVQAGLKLGPERMRKYVKAFGFGDSTGSLLSGEIGGKVTSADKWSTYTMGSVPMGYEINVTSLQMATAYCAIANGGMLPRPRIVKEIRDRDGGVAERSVPEFRRRVVSEKTARLMRETLRRVVVEGTGRRANIPEYQLGGKTGTANMIANAEERRQGVRGYSKKRHTANFVALAPWDKPKAIIYVSIRETGKYGGEAAAPVVAGVARRLLAYWGVPTADGSLVDPGRSPRTAAALAADRAAEVDPVHVIGLPDDENVQNEEVDPRLWEEWIEDESAVG